MIDITEIKGGRLNSNQKKLIELFESENGGKYKLKKYESLDSTLEIICNNITYITYSLISQEFFIDIEIELDENFECYSDDNSPSKTIFSMYEIPFENVYISDTRGIYNKNVTYETGTIISLFKKYVAEFNS